MCCSQLLMQNEKNSYKVNFCLYFKEMEFGQPSKTELSVVGKKS